MHASEWLVHSPLPQPFPECLRSVFQSVVPTPAAPAILDVEPRNMFSSVLQVILMQLKFDLMCPKCWGLKKGVLLSSHLEELGVGEKIGRKENNTVQ